MKTSGHTTGLSSSIRVQLYFRLEEVGGRKAPPINLIYRPSVKFDAAQNHNSVQITFDELPKVMEACQADMRFLIDVPWYATKGTLFEVCEGSRVVAYGEVV